MISCNEEIILAKMSTQKVLPIVRTSSVEKAILQLEDLVKQGYEIAEVSATTPEFQKAIKHMGAVYPEFLIGAGTILTLDQAKLALEVGAKFFLSPGLPLDIEKILSLGIPFVPGVMTGSEVAKAHGLEMNLLKLFPASFVGPQYLKQLSAPFPNVDFIAVGGLNLLDVQSWTNAGAVGVGIGSALTNKNENAG